eukprot:TRINITY_DN5814_c0_g1_i2.p1 TRINITY_DN5814_c0_g1~~TRINITY_DN5814_c0_g1_i2.p1  ORF type:complete len:236 (-),score=77.06 TRINITY_DN5814_c0_g1_i2:231-938(-)
MAIKIGVLALQGAFIEHVALLKQIEGVETREIRNKEDFEGLDGLIIPGGESTTMALVGDKNGVLEEVKKWVVADKPTWGTCAGCIMLANSVTGQKIGGQGLIGGMDISVHRNYFGRQLNSFESSVSLSLPSFDVAGGKKELSFPGIFIRAPAILSVGTEVEGEAKGKKEDVKILGVLPVPSNVSSSPSPSALTDKVIVAAQQGKKIATVFHPELTSDLSLHLYFVELIKNAKQSQ